MSVPQQQCPGLVPAHHGDTLITQCANRQSLCDTWRGLRQYGADTCEVVYGPLQQLLQDQVQVHPSGLQLRLLLDLCSRGQARHVLR